LLEQQHINNMKRVVNKFSDICIKRISVYQVDLPLHEGSYKWSDGKQVNVFDATVVKIETNVDGITGYGENTPLGPSYLPAFAGGSRAAIRELAPSLIGENPTYLNNLNTKMDFLLKGHNYAKSAIDMACWDILGKVAGLPVCELLGGRFGQSFSLYRAISQREPKEMANNVEKYLSEGYRKFQLKVGGDPFVDIERIKAVRASLDEFARHHCLASLPLMCDANTGWLRHQAMQVVQGVKHLENVFIEQPCLTYDECFSVRQRSPLPMILDECMDDIGVLTRILNDKSADMINLKISKVGGLTKARAIRDLAVASGIPMNIEDTW